MAQPPDELLEAVDQDPDSLEKRRVLGDWLTEHGDPRGELIGLHAKELVAQGPLLSARRVLTADYLAKTGEALWGPLPEPCRRTTYWRLGYWDAISVSAEVDLTAVLAHPSARFLRRLATTGHATVLAQRLPQLDQLEVTLHGTWQCVTGEVAPKLKTLWLCCSGLKAAPDLPPVEELRLEVPSGETGTSRGYEAASWLPWTTLARLEIESWVSLTTIENFLSPGRCPQLKRASIHIDIQDLRLLGRLPPPALDLLDVYVDNDEYETRATPHALRSFVSRCSNVRVSSGRQFFR